AMPTDHSVEQTRALMIFLKPILVGGHSLETQDVDGFQIGIHFDKSVCVEQILDPLHGWLRKVIFASRTDTLILRKLDLRHDFRATRAFLEQTARNVFLLPTLCLDCWFAKDWHDS